MNMLATLLGGSGSDSSAGGAAFVVVVFLISAAVTVLVIASMWRVFTKAGQKGWLALIPILNFYVLIKIVGRESWWIILYFIPCVNIVVTIIVMIDLAKVFGRSTAYGLGLVFLPFIFYPMLAFGDATYEGDAPPIF
jgi:hypothetical protein